jgi:beta-galactosidase GanA
MSLPVTAKVPFGGDYNPEQWREEVWQQDYQLFDAARIDTVTLNVFAWALVQPSEDVYDFALLDRIVGRASAQGRQICLATGTGAHPACLARAYPEVTRTDFEGRRHRYGQRHNSCPSSPVLRRLSAEPARRYAGDSPLLFELVIPEGAEVVGSYRADFYAGTPAVTRNSFGDGHGWYVGAGLDQAGVSWVVRQVLARHDLLGPYPDVPDLETALRVTLDGTRLLFLLNHRAEPVEVTTRIGGVDLLTGDRIAVGQRVRLTGLGVVLLREEW